MTQQKLKSERHNVFIEEIDRISLKRINAFKSFKIKSFNLLKECYQ